jgi:hypothetical protein
VEANKNIVVDNDGDEYDDDDSNNTISPDIEGNETIHFAHVFHRTEILYYYTL